MSKKTKKANKQPKKINSNNKLSVFPLKSLICGEVFYIQSYKELQAILNSEE
jgi:hypothetical protein